MNLMEFVGYHLRQFTRAGGGGACITTDPLVQN